MRYKLLLPFFLFATATFAQRTNFSGTWNLKDQQSISGKMYSNGVPKVIKVTQSTNDITIEKTSAGASGDVISSETVLNGKPFETVTPSKRKKISVIKWSGDTGFTETTNIYSAADNTKLEFTYTDIWSMEDGKFIMQRKADNFVNGEVWESKAVYEKE